MNANFWRRVDLRAISQAGAHLDVVLDVNRKRSRCVKSLRKIDVCWSSWHDCSIDPQLSGLGVNRITSGLENIDVDLGRRRATVRDWRCPAQHIANAADTVPPSWHQALASATKFVKMVSASAVLKQQAFRNCLFHFSTWGTAQAAHGL